MADVCLPLSAGDNTFELHSVLEAVEKQIRVLEQRQSQLRERRAALETSRADTHKSRVSIQRAANSPTTSTPCVSLHRPGAPRTRSAQMSFTPALGHHGPWVHPQRRTRARPRATTSPPPVFEISTRNRFSPLRETERDAVIVGDSIVRHVRATLAEGNVHTHCFPGARVLDVSAQIPAILKADESPRAVVLHAGVNDTTQRQTETLKRDFRSLIETVRSTTPAATIIVSGPLPTYRRGHERIYTSSSLDPEHLRRGPSEDLR
uniref:SGNH hydrolase-type esterase domain-containing protein n=1 Tax=Cyprinus carpio carpio TaxID=630221 RepID=A0A9J8CGB3_CYPCA